MFEARDRRGVIGRLVALQNARAARGGNAVRADDVFHGQRHAGQRGERVTGGDGGVDPVGLGVGALGRKREINIQFGIALLDARVEFLHQLARGDFPGVQRRADFGNRPFCRGAHFSITRGTRK